MHKLIVTGVVLIVALLTGLLLSRHAQAMAAPASTAMIEKFSPIENVAYRCQKVWRCGYHGCALHRECRSRAPRPRPYGWDYPWDWQSHHFWRQ